MTRRMIAIIVAGTLVALSLIAIVAIASQYRVYQIPSNAMAPAISQNDRVYARKISGRSAHRGDIVIYRPIGEAPSIVAVVKRIVAVGGERVDAINGQLQINGRPASEPYLAPGTVTEDVTPMLVPSGEVYMLGDNREESSDSRVQGPVPIERITARVDFVNVRIDWIAYAAAAVCGLFACAVVFAPKLRPRKQERPAENLGSDRS